MKRLTDFRVVLLLVIAAALALSACQQPAPAPTPTPSVAVAPSPSPASALTASPTPSPSPIIDAFPEVWSSNGYDGQSYEFKTNCFKAYDELEACPLSQMSRIVAISPAGTEYELEKDFNVNSYSGEVTRRWVIYGPPGEGLPAPGEYSFVYYKGNRVVLQQSVTYRPEVVDFPRDVKWSRDGRALVISWTPPADVREGMWYKVLVFPKEGQLLSKVFDWSARKARLEDVPLQDGTHGTANVAIYFQGGYAYSEYLPLEW